MNISVLASGSSGNSTYIESKEANVLIDAGISARRILSNLDILGKDISEVDAILVTHEHTDHIKGIERLNKSFDVPVMISRATYEFSGLDLNRPKFFSPEQEFTLNDLRITPKHISHDAVDPCGFSIKQNGSLIGVFTDLGIANNGVKKTISEADALVIESNHDIDMVLNGPYPYELKQRILGEKGHLSNIDTGLLVSELGSEKLKSVFLAHISQNNNTNELVDHTFSKLTKDKRINKIITNQNEATELINI